MHINAFVFLDALRPAITEHEFLTTRQLYVLVYLKAEDKGEPIDFNVIWKHMKISKPALTRAIDKLEQMNMVWRTKYEDDHRKAYVTLTVKGHDFVGEVLGHAV